MQKISQMISLFFLFPQLVFCLTFHQSQETLHKIKQIISQKEKGVYLRFGDGDLLLAHGKGDSYQQANILLQFEMREAFALNGPTILKGLPLGCEKFNGLEKGMFPGNHEWSDQMCSKAIDLAHPLWNGPIDDVYSMTAFAHLATSDLNASIEFLQFLKKSNVSIFIGNENIPISIIHLLFGPQCKIIPTPAKNSYSAINQIEAKCKELASEQEDYQVIITSMGCSGRALQKRLWNQLENVFLFDFGSLMDAICGWTSRQWICATDFNQIQFLEILTNNL